MLYVERYSPEMQGNVAANNVGLATIEPVDLSASATVALPSGTTVGGVPIGGLASIVSTSATAFTVASTSTNYGLQVDESTASAVTGVKIKAGASGTGVAFSTIGGATDEGLKLDAKGAGLLTINGTGTGNVVIGHGLTATTATLTGAGAVGLTTLTTKIVSTGANALTLADGVDGQIKILVMTTDGGDATLTPTTKTGFSTIVFNDAGDGCSLVFTTTTGWIVYSNNGCTIS